jgi:hypothetical protein
MIMPSFPAEASLGRTSGTYRSTSNLDPAHAIVQPAFPTVCDTTCLDKLPGRVRRHRRCSQRRRQRSMYATQLGGARSTALLSRLNGYVKL